MKITILFSLVVLLAASGVFFWSLPCEDQEEEMIQVHSPVESEPEPSDMPPELIEGDGGDDTYGFDLGNFHSISVSVDK